MFVIVAVIMTAIIVTLVLKYLFNWVNVNNIPSKVIEEAAEKLMKGKFDRAESEIAEMKEREEERMKSVRKENTEHEEILIEREKKLNKRSKLLDEKSDELEAEEAKLKQGLKNLEQTRIELKDQLEKISGLSREEAREKLMKEIDQDLNEYKARKIRMAEKKIEAERMRRLRRFLLSLCRELQQIM